MFSKRECASQVSEPKERDQRETKAHILFTIGSYIKIYVRLSTKLVYL